MEVAPAYYKVKTVPYVDLSLLKTAIIYRSTERISFHALCGKMALVQ